MSLVSDHECGIVAHLCEPHRAAWIYRTYKERQTVEQFFKEGNQSFNTGKMPSQRLRANQAYLYFVGIGYNCFLWFKKTAPVRLHPFMLATIRRKLIWSPAEVVFSESAIEITYHPQHRYKRIIRYITNRVNLLNMRN